MKIKKLLAVILFTVLSTIAIGQTVHYTRTGHKYHSEGCQYLRRSDYTCQLKEAISMGLGPCSRCSPPREVKEEKVVITKEVKKKKKTSLNEIMIKERMRRRSKISYAIL